MAYFWSAIGAVAVAGIIYFLLLLKTKRNELNGLPQPPMQNWLLGHLHIAGICQQLFPRGIHQHNWVRFIQKSYNQGDVFYLDWWPLGPRWLFIADPEISSQYLTSTQNLPKSPLETYFLDNFLGPHNMVSVEGAHWKNLRTMFNPGFSAAHLMTLVPYIVDSSKVFCDVLKKKAESNELFELEEYGTRLTIDIIGKVVLDSDFDSQKQPHPIVDTFRKRLDYMPESNGLTDFLHKYQFIRRWGLWRNGVKLDRLIGEELDRKIAARSATTNANGSAKGPTSFKDRKRSVIDLALDAYQKEFATSAKPGAPMDKTFRNAAIDSMKTFIFAGHDTTASTIAYIFYLLHFHPSVHDKVIEELDTVFGAGADTDSIGTQIRDDAYIVNKLEYLTAVIKETLRLFPPASTLRYTGSRANLTFTDPADPTRQLPLSGFDIWPIVHLISRNEKFFPQPARFIPERFIQALTPFPFPQSHLHTPAGRDAWRPFEKGPRSCIGEQLAMLEMRVILAMSVRNLDFVCEFNGTPVQRLEVRETSEELPEQKRDWEAEKGLWKAGRKVGEDGQWVGRTVEGHQCWQILRGAAKPRGGMPGRMKLR
jgi:cytochrome P450